MSSRCLGICTLLSRPQHPRRTTQLGLSDGFTIQTGLALPTKHLSTKHFTKVHKVPGKGPIHHCAASTVCLAAVENKAAVGVESKLGKWGIYNFKATVQYDGSLYKGFQIQRGKQSVPTIQQKLEQAITSVKGEDRRVLRVQGAGRTDAGVHARGQVINFYSHKLTPPVDRLCLAINSRLPADIRVTQVERVPPDFSARYSSLSKLYSYSLQTCKVSDPFTRLYSHHVYKPLDVARMRQAARNFVGVHNFWQFSTMPAVRRPLDPVKHVHRVDIVEPPETYPGASKMLLDATNEGELWSFKPSALTPRVWVPGGLRVVLHGSGFLYNMVRHMVGALLSVGFGNLDPQQITGLLAVGEGAPPGERYRGWTLAPAQGLCLEEVRYPAPQDPEQLLYPELPHDEHGRVWVDAFSSDGDERVTIRHMKAKQALAACAF